MNARMFIIALAVASALGAPAIWAQETPAPSPTPEPAAPATPEAPAGTVADLLTVMPAATRTFVAVADVAEVAAKAILFSQRTGLKLPLGDSSIADLIGLKVGARGGLARRGAAGIAYLNPKAFPGRNTVFLVPVQGRDEFVEYNAAREVEAGLYQFTTTAEPRFFSFREGYAVFSDSIRTSRTLRDGSFGLGDTLSEDRVKAAAGSDVYVHVDLYRTLESRADAAETFRTAVSAKVMGDPTLMSYSDLLLGYMTALNETVNQVESVDIGLTFRADDLGLSLFVGFAEDGGIHQGLLSLGGGEGSLVGDLPLGRPVVSAGGARADGEAMRRAAVAVIDFLMMSSPRSRKGVQPQTRDHLMGAVDDLMTQFTGQFAFMSTLPDPESKATDANLLVVGVKDDVKFISAMGGIFGAMLKVSDEVGARVTLQYMPEQETYRDVRIDHVKPRIAFVSQRFERLFGERAEALYGPDGFLYRMALVENRLYVTLGSDLTLFHEAIDNALDDKPPAMSEAILKAQQGLPARRNVEYYASLPALLSRHLILAGPAQGASRGPVEFDDEDRKFIEDQGVVGVALSFEGGRIRTDTRLGYDHLAKAVAFAQRHLPPMIPEPTPEPTEELTEPAGPTPEPTLPLEPVPGPGPTPEPAPVPGPTP